jgi:threonine synthase
MANGRVLTVSEQQIADAKAIIGRDGIGCEPASATTVAGIKQLVKDGMIQAGQTVVAVLTGHVLKDTDYVMNYHGDTLYLEGEGDEQHRLQSTFANRPVRVKATREAILDQFEESREDQAIRDE